uniref:hypothetical protein n=1 Tax=uncultured Draconibacterium sp. TaxID=1573823 RepID=UPI0032173406
MSKLYVVKDGIKGVGCVVDKEGNQVFDESFHLITYNFKSDQGYIQPKKAKWRLYTTIQKNKPAFKEHYNSFAECVVKLQHLSYPLEIEIIDSLEVEKIKSELHDKN